MPQLHFHYDLVKPKKQNGVAFTTTFLFDFGQRPSRFFLPVTYLRMISELVFNVGCSSGPMTIAGLMVTKSIF